MKRINRSLFIKNFVKLSRIRSRCYCEIFPSSQVTFIKKRSTKDDNLKQETSIDEKHEQNVSKEFRVNEFNIQMISKNIYDQLFKEPSVKADPNVIKSCQENLMKHGIDFKQNPFMPDVELKLPELQGKDVVEHFYNIGEQQSAPYRDLLKKLATCSIPEPPKKWSKMAGWTKYSVNEPPKPVPCPSDDALIFDVEVLMSAGKRPTLACAVSPDAWYGWVSEPLANGDPQKSFDHVNYEDLIPLETDGDQPCGNLGRPRIVVGHNVSYDRSKIKEQYWLDKTGVRFMDTMSMHTCVSGVTSYQRTVLKAKNKEPDPTDDYWMEISSLNSLTEVNIEGVRFMDTVSMHTCVSGVTSYQRTVLKAKNKEPDPTDDYWMEISSLNSLTEVNIEGVRFMDTVSMHTCVSGVTSYQRTVLKAKNKEPDPTDDYWMEISSLNSLTEVNIEGVRFMDTMSMHTCVSGVTSYQRTVLKAKNKEPDPTDDYWMEISSLNSLTEVNIEGVRFMDTMSMHTCVNGVTSYQRTVLKAKNKEPDPTDDYWMEISSLNSLTEVHKLYCGVPVDKQTRNVFVDGTMRDVHASFQQLMAYCANDVIATHNVLGALLPLFLERFPHPVTLAGMLELGSAYLPVNSNWLQYIDSSETIFEDLKLESKQILSQKADEACKLMKNEAYKKDLWMWDQDWSTQTLKLKKTTPKKKKSDDVSEVKLATNEFKNRTLRSETEFDIICNEYIETIENKFFQPDTIDDVEALTKKFAYLFNLKESLPVKRPYLAGYPAWYRKLCTKPTKETDWEPRATNITTSMQITPKLLCLSWEGYPLHYIQGEGWGFLVPFRRENDSEDLPKLPLAELLEKCPVAQCKESQDQEEECYVLPKTVEEDQGRRAYFARKKYDEKAKANQYHGLGVWCGIQLQGCCHFLRLPHKDGPKYKVGNPLARDFLDMFSQNVLSAQGNDAEKVLSFGRMMSYWRNNRERIGGQQVVWLPQHALPPALRGMRRYGAILPQVVACGTLTRRASEPTWMTASNAQKDRIGSELRAMVQAPPGYKFVGADVDSQELWIAALLGDSSLSSCGGTALGWAVLAGDKARRTDVHSLTARSADISRAHAKVINYARIYGAGQTFAERLLKQFNPTMTISEAKSKAAKMYASTKGRRVYVLKKKYMEGMMDEDLDEKVLEMSGYQAIRLAKMSGKRVEEMFERPRWVGGTESEMFNKLEDIAESESPSTAFLSGRLSRALEHARGRWASTRLNWAVQSAAADFLHLMLASMRQLAPTARFCLSFHDEVRYLVPEEQKYEAALALHTTNLLTRAFCSQRVGINDLPLSVAFFTSVEVDQVLRKEADLCCTTPSNPHGLKKGYGIPNGESLNIHQVIDRCTSK